MLRRSGAAMVASHAAAAAPLSSCQDARVLIAHWICWLDILTPLYYTIFLQFWFWSYFLKEAAYGCFIFYRVPPEETFDCMAGTDGCLLHLKNPKTGAKSCYMMTGDILQEIHWFKEQFSSWFLGNYVLEDGSLYIGTPVDPIFLLLPLLEEARMKRADDAGKFRSLEDILYVEGYPGYQNLSRMLGNALDAVCEVRDIGASKFYRLEDSKVLSWLSCKVKLTMKGLGTLEGYDSILESAKEVLAIGLLGDYLKDCHWLETLCHHLGVDPKATKKPECKEIYESDSFPIPKPNAGKGEQKGLAGKGKMQKKANTVGMKKVTQFFARER